MTYTFKLSRRLALSHVASAAALVLSAACGGDAESLDPTVPGQASVSDVVVAPKQSTVPIAHPTKFTAWGLTPEGDSLLIDDLEWSADGGSISQDGVFQASSSGTYQLVAYSRKRRKSDTSTVVVTPAPTLSAVVVLPGAVTLAPGAKQAFAASGRMSDGTAASVAVTWTATGGTIDTAGLYAAGATAGTYRVIATQQDGTLADTSTVTIGAPVAPTLASVVLSPASVALAAGGTQQFSATGRLGDGSTVAAPVTWTATGGSVSSSGLYTAGSTAGTYRVIAASGGVADTSTVTVAAPSTPIGGNVPSGFTLLTSRRFDAKVEDGWTDRGDANFSIVQKADAPRSASNVGQALFAEGFPSGSGPISTSYFMTGKKQLYIDFTMQLSSNWDGNDAGVNKIFFVWMHGNPSVCVSATGVGANPLVPQIRLQNTPMGSVNRSPNLDTSKKIVRGQWHRWEIVLVANTPGVADGEVHWWVDGVKVGAYTGQMFAGAGQANTWDRFSWNPTYGGAGDPVPYDQFMWMDHIALSAR